MGCVGSLRSLLLLLWRAHDAPWRPWTAMGLMSLPAADVLSPKAKRVVAASCSQARCGAWRGLWLQSQPLQVNRPEDPDFGAKICSTDLKGTSNTPVQAGSSTHRQRHPSPPASAERVLRRAVLCVLPELPDSALSLCAALHWGSLSLASCACCCVPLSRFRCPRTSRGALQGELPAARPG